MVENHWKVLKIYSCFEFRNKCRSQERLFDFPDNYAIRRQLSLVLQGNELDEIKIMQFKGVIAIFGTFQVQEFLQSFYSKLFKSKKLVKFNKSMS